MRRILAFAVCGLSLGACTSADLFKLDTTPTPVNLRLESQPPGADAKLSSGDSCKTPCTLPVNVSGGLSSELTVTYTLDGYQPQALTVDVVPPLDPREGPARISPNPVTAELEAAPPPARRRPATKRVAPRKPAAQPAAQRPAAAPAPAEPAPATAPAQAPAPAGTQSSPWPPAPGQPPAQQ
ncbi:MAG: hypothetical protein GEU91_00215 [Rhizobiales bacterium]|nr:hypothetical protein [Hyphomicrobiales bacterium]